MNWENAEDGVCSFSDAGGGVGFGTCDMSASEMIIMINVVQDPDFCLSFFVFRTLRFLVG